jgi:hypothetical protein
MKRLCKECRRKRVAGGKSLVSYAARKLGYCLGCYRELYPERPMWNLPVLRMGSERLLSYDQLKGYGLIAPTE